MEHKKVIYISGPITGVDKYWEVFEQAEEDLISLGYLPLSPAHLPQGMTQEQYMHIDFAMIDSADAVLFLPGWIASQGSRLERNYCEYSGKPIVDRKGADLITPRAVGLAWLEHDLGEVLKK